MDTQNLIQDAMRRMLEAEGFNVCQPTVGDTFDLPQVEVNEVLVVDSDAIVINDDVKMLPGGEQ